jgi:hypothetical protein
MSLCICLVPVAKYLPHLKYEPLENCSRDSDIPVTGTLNRSCYPLRFGNSDEDIRQKPTPHKLGRTSEHYLQAAVIPPAWKPISENVLARAITIDQSHQLENTREVLFFGAL